MKKTIRQRISILGAGAFGSSFAQVLAHDFDISLWARDTAVASAINTLRQHPKRLAGIFFLPGVTASTNLEQSLQGASLVISALPLVSLREVWKRAAPFLHRDAYILSVTKGIEENSLALPAGILQEVLPKDTCNRLAFLSGPTFAQELAAGLPTAATIASEKEESAIYVQKMISVANFRAYVSNDVAGVELGGALKNVIAIAAGIGHGLNLGQNAQAALITRGIAEVSRLAVAMGAQPATLAGLSGLGDLVLTCSSTMSRNFRLGVGLSQEKSLAAVLAEINQTVEGVNTAKSARRLSEKYGVEMPISDAVFSILFEQAPPRQVVYELMTRKLKHELS